MKTVKNWLNKINRSDVYLSLFSAGVFILWPELDLVVTGYFYDGQKFFLADNPLILLPYTIFAKAHIPMLIGLLIIYLINYRKTLNKQITYRRRCAFLLLLLVIGPGLLVNGFLKEHSFGRPRPVQTTEFGGEATFAPAFQYSGACEHNCSFSSGHAALGYSFIALAWIFPSRALFFGAFALGSYVGFGRVIQGGHFLSDVLMSFWVCYWATRALAFYFPVTTLSPWRGNDASVRAVQD